jgi:hypothetical protein
MLCQRSLGQLDLTTSTRSDCIQPCADYYHGYVAVLCNVRFSTKQPQRNYRSTSEESSCSSHSVRLTADIQRLTSGTYVLPLADDEVRKS